MSSREGSAEIEQSMWVLKDMPQSPSKFSNERAVQPDDAQR